MTGDADSKFRGYLLYAVGEIVLVVIGILIALQIGEWNERRADEADLVALLHDVQDDLASDVQQANRSLPAGAMMDELVDSILEGAFDRDDYLGTGWEDRGPGRVGPDARFDLFWVGMQYIPYTPTRIAYDRLADFEGAVPIRFGPLLERLSAHYVQQWEMHERRNDIFIRQIENRHERFSHEYPWYWRLRSGEWDEEMVEWHMNSDVRRGYLLRYAADQTLRPGSYVDEYRASAIGIYLEIAEFLGEEITHDPIPRNLAVEDPERISNWFGAWSVEQGSPFTVEIRRTGRYVMLQGMPLVPVNDTVFHPPFVVNLEGELIFTTDSTGTPIVRSVDDDGTQSDWFRVGALDEG